MKISLKKFESEIDERIVGRGKEYFDCDAVRGLKKIKDDQWVASVDGTETYKVCVNLKGDNVEGMVHCPRFIFGNRCGRICLIWCVKTVVRIC